MRTRMLAVFAVVLFWAAGSVCLAADAVQPGEIELYPTYTALGIEIPYSGDDNGDATAEFIWRKGGEKDWQDGVDMTIDRERHLVWASVWPLDEGETVEVTVTFDDPQTPGLLPLTASATTKKMILENAGGQNWFVAPEGNDAAAGTEDKPFGTIAHAVSAAKPGDTVVVSSGVYREGDLGKGVIGESNKPIIITAAGGAKPVVDGSVEIAKGSDGWSKLEGDTYARDFSPETGYCGYVAQDGLRMFWYKKGVDFKNDSLKAGRSCYFDQMLKKLYVRTGDSSSPTEHTYNIAVYPYGLHLSGSRYVTVKGFDIRFFGEAAVRISDGARGSVVVANRIHNAPAGILVLDEATCETAIWRNEIYEEGLTDFTWRAVKRSNYARQGTHIMAGRGTSVCYNTIHGYFDGVEADSWHHPNDLGINRDLDIMYNKIYNTGDDAMEPDGGGVNMRIHKNRMRNVFSAISLAPVERGPVYCTRNDATYYILMFKLNVGGCTSRGWAYCYHNCGYCLMHPEGDAWGGIAVSFPANGAIPITNKVFKNNAVIAVDYGIRSAHKGEFLDYNCYCHVPGTTPLVFSWETQTNTLKWEVQRFYNLPDFRKATGQEEHGFYANPLFVSTPDLGKNLWKDYAGTAFGTYPQAKDVSTGDLHLQKTSPCIDAGAVIRGVNEDFSGKAPDIGAFEFQGMP